MFLRSSLILSGLSLCLFVGALPARAEQPSEWNAINSPARLEPNFDYHFNSALLNATVPLEHKPYADTYWPTNRGGIAYRWHSKQPEFQWQDPHIVASSVIFNYHSPSREEAARMSRDELEQLSPAEKYDLVRGKYDYPMTNEVLHARRGLTLKVTNGQHRAYWEGICHGWAPASVNHSEPMKVDVTNPQGIVVPFGSADVKAILDFMYATVDPHVRQMGKRCSVDLTKNPNSQDPDCLDVNAGAFHVVLTNYIGMRGIPFVADVSRGNEVWNNPIYSYSSKIVETTGPIHGSAPATVRRVHLQTSVKYASDDERLAPQWEPTVNQEEVKIPDNSSPLTSVDEFATKYRYEEAHYEYWIEVNSAGEIIGGDWVSFDRPDYIWMKAKLSFTGDFSALHEIYRPMFK